MQGAAETGGVELKPRASSSSGRNLILTARPRSAARAPAIILTLTGVLAAVSAGPAAAQAVMLDVGAVVVLLEPNPTIELPVTLNAPGEGPVHVTMELAYPTDTLKFLNVKPAAILEATKTQVTAEAKPVQTGAKEQIIAIEIKAPSPLTSGALATVNFTTTEAAAPGMELPVRNVSRTAKSASGQALEARGAEGMITLVEPPAPCFFYMH
jgi:hypothetical protein